MDREEKKQERSFELRSEKVRSIVGQIPSSLVRYGISVIGVVLLCLFGVACFLPYKQVYSGTAIIRVSERELETNAKATKLLLIFGEKRPNSQVIEGADLMLQSPDGHLAGKLIKLSAVRDTLGRQEAIIGLPQDSLIKMQGQTVDFILTQYQGSLLESLLSFLK
ncbi:hypothetical protein [Porphyromonas pogonae]|uniref:hypothetical protein n=1 Tax=Porphyromonas pogonae TaxID=867595 RepID=UPI002E77E95F|nr:hypothetical protein [Porphyromonas pogonae]